MVSLKQTLELKSYGAGDLEKHIRNLNSENEYYVEKITSMRSKIAELETQISKLHQQLGIMNEGKTYGAEEYQRVVIDSDRGEGDSPKKLTVHMDADDEDPRSLGQNQDSMGNSQGDVAHFGGTDQNLAFNGSFAEFEGNDRPQASNVQAKNVSTQT